MIFAKQIIDKTKVNGLHTKHHKKCSIQSNLEIENFN